MAQRIMVVSILRADRSISGLAMRFVALWSYLAAEREEENVWLFSSESLLDRVLGKGKRPSRVVSFEDRGKGYLLRRAWSLAKFLGSVVLLRIDTVHLAAGGSDFLVAMPLLRLLRVKVCLTFATAGMEVGVSGKHLQRLHFALRSAPNVEFLNPVAVVPDYPQKRFYSPCSFPYILALGQTVQPAPAERRKNLILYAGSFAPHKNPVMAVDAFAGLLERRPPESSDLELLLFGRGELESNLRRRAEEINESVGREAVRFLPEAELFAHLAIARIFLSLQEPDNYPSQSLMEAMLYENCVVATDVGQTRRIVPEQGNALVAVDVASVEEGLFRLLAGPVCNPGNARFIRDCHSPARFAVYFLDVHRDLQ